MATHISAEKRHRQSLKRRERNTRHMSEMKSAIRSLRQLITQKKKDEAKKNLNSVKSLIDSNVSRKVLKRNTASRYVSRLSAQIDRL